MGHVVGVYIAPTGSAPMQALDEVQAIAGRGLAGDRYLLGIGFYSPRPTEPGAREVTLIEAEVLDRLRADHGLALDAAETRRNVITRGIRLEDLLGKRFRVGPVLLEA